MEDNLLARARLLIAAANGPGAPSRIGHPPVSEQQSSPDRINIGGTSSHRAPDQQSSSSPGSKSISIDSRSELSFRCSVINGSSLINTFDDIRAYVEKGGLIHINSVPYHTSPTGEWSHNCIELVKDYQEETNFDSSVTIPRESSFPSFHLSKKKAIVVPVPSLNISQAVEQLSGVTEACQTKLANAAYRPILPATKKPKKAVVLPEVTAHDPLLQRSQALLASIRGGIEGNKTPRSSSRLSRVPSQVQSPNDNSQDSYSYNSYSSLFKPNIKPQHELEEQRRQALRRVQVKLREDQQRADRLEKDAQQLASITKEASLLKAKMLQEKTQQRVEKYKEELSRREAELKRREEAVLQQKQLKSEQVQSEHHRRRLEELSRESKRRIQELDRLEYQRSVEKEEEMQRKLGLIAQRVDPVTTFIPRVDGGRHFKAASADASTGVNATKPAPRKAAVEQIDLVEMRHPFDPMLPGAESLLRSKSAGIAGSRRTQDSSSHAILPARDDDEWSDDEPEGVVSRSQYNRVRIDEQHTAPSAVAKQPLVHVMSKQSAGTSNRKPVLVPLTTKPIRNGEYKSSGNISSSRNTNAGVRARDPQLDEESSDDLSDVTIDSMNASKRSHDRLPLAVLNLDDDGVPHRDNHHHHHHSSSNSKALHSHDSSRNIPAAAAGRKNRFKKLPPIPLSAPYKPVPVENMR